jgi:hypothetical protein
VKERYVNASEIGTYVFCAKAWQLSQIGAPSQNTAEQKEDIDWHGRIPSTSPPPNVRADSQQFSPLLS